MTICLREIHQKRNYLILPNIVLLVFNDVKKCVDFLSWRSYLFGGRKEFISEKNI
jgi:hypothetical protein